MRGWWIDSIMSINQYGVFPYADCEMAFPPAIFEDRTDSLYAFEQDLLDGSQARLQKALNNDMVMNANVLCPFGCSEFCRMTGSAHWGEILQQYLMKVVLPLETNTRISNYHSMSP